MDVHYEIIRPAPDSQLPFIDLRNLEGEKMEEQAALLTLEERTQPFNLSVGPLLRTKLVRLTDEDHLLLVTLRDCRLVIAGRCWCCAGS